MWLLNSVLQTHKQYCLQQLTGMSLKAKGSSSSDWPEVTLAGSGYWRGFERFTGALKTNSLNSRKCIDLIALG